MDTPPRKLPPKKDVLEAFLGNGSARVFVDPRRPDVNVPKWYLKQPELVLRVGHALSPPIPDLLVTDEAVSCTLSFNRSPFWCKLPWSAVFAVVSDVDGRGVVWPEDVPIESQLLKPARQKPKLASVAPPTAPSAAAAAETPSDAEKPAKESAAGAAQPEGAAAAEPASAPAAAAEPTPEGEPEAGKKPKRQLPPYLRVVK
ncbi:MAG: hypothetical protein IPG04_32395 [Polyangiaceae bacterium]|jgi:stringent starvation protein B|nr:hypothetical protein [Polyangiaceae bacterium]